MKRRTDPFERVDRALGIFTRTVDELRDAASVHADIANAADEQIGVLVIARTSHETAARAAIQRADKIAELLA